MRMSNSIKNISAALLAAQKEMEGVVKGADNPYYKTKYADINEVIKTVKDPLNKHGILISQPNSVTATGASVVETLLIHAESGEFIVGETLVVTKEVDAQKHGAAITYSRRFGLQSILGLPALDDDGNYASNKTEKLEASESKPKTATVVASKPAASLLTKAASFKKQPTVPVAETSGDDLS